jgi:hypothetical protein
MFFDEVLLKGAELTESKARKAFLMVMMYNFRVGILKRLRVMLCLVLKHRVVFVKIFTATR